MPRKIYKHIELPHQLISGERQYVPPPRRNIRERPAFNIDRHRTQLARNVRRIERFYSDREGEHALVDGHGNNELKIAFRGPYDSKLTNKYGIGIYRTTKGRGDSETIYGKISGVRREGQNQSDFERLKNDILEFQKTGRYRSYFNWVRDLQPLEIKEVIDPSFLKSLRSHPTQSRNVDVSFASNREASAEKIASIETRYRQQFLSKVNTESLHYCRIRATYPQIEEIFNGFRGISKIEPSPIYIAETSMLRREINGLGVTNPPRGITPVIIFDTDINQNHATLQGAVEELRNNDSSDLEHGTAVASLVVCGQHLNTGGLIEQNNRVIGVKVSANNFDRLEQIIQETIENLAQRYPILIANLSINVNHIIYPRNSGVDKLTILLDDLAKEHGCMFVISAGNLFNNNWPPDLVQRLQHMGYPDYFKDRAARILPPADSINNISVGSVAFQQSADSMAAIKSPTIHTRANLPDFPFVKPDLVHYDCNYRSDFSCEENGVLMAGNGDNVLTSMPGTSFAAPLVSHDLMLLHNKYPNLRAATLKVLMIHFADRNIGKGIRSEKIRDTLIGFGLPDAEKTLYSDSHHSTIIIEDDILVGQEKTIRFPMPASLAGSHARRVRVRKTLIYHPPVNSKNPRLYNPIDISIRLHRSDNRPLSNRATRSIYDGAPSRANVKKYPAVEKSTQDHMGGFWSLVIGSENRDPSFVSSTYRQPYSIILSVEDIQEADGIDLHEDISNMIEIETHVHVPVEVA